MAGNVGYDETLYIGDQEVANNVTVQSGGVLDVGDGGVASSAIVERGGTLQVRYGAFSDNAVISSGGSLVGYLGFGTADNTTVHSGGYFLGFRYNGAGTTTLAKLGGGSVLCNLSSAVVDSGNTGYIGSDGHGTDLVIKHGGRIRVEANGLTEDVTINSGGLLALLDGGVASDTVVERGGTLQVQYGAFSDNAVISSGGSLVGYLGFGTADNTTVHSGGYVVGFRYDGAGSTTISTIADNSIQGNFSSAVVGSGNIGYIGSGGVVRHVEIKNGGSMYIENGGTAGGHIQIANGARVSAYKGSVIDFTLSEHWEQETALISNWSAISGCENAAYTMTVADNQGSCVYTLAAGAADFDHTITVKSTSGESMGTISVGESLKFDTISMSLTKESDKLLLSLTNSSPDAKLPEYIPPVVEPPAVTDKVIAADIDGSGVSDVMFQYTGGNYQLGFWMNGTNEWKSQGKSEPVEWEVLGAYDMDSSGKADAVLVGNVTVEGIKGAFIGYYKDADTSVWENISYLTNAEGIVWKNKVGNLTGNEGKNSIVWHAEELGALGVWTDGTDNWKAIDGYYGTGWTLLGTGDFDGDGKDEVLLGNNDAFYSVDIDNKFTSLGTVGAGWEVRAVGDFTQDGKDDIIIFHEDTGVIARLGGGQMENWHTVGQLDAQDWFVVGTGEYNGSGADDLLVRQYSTGMLGYYANGDMSKWVELGRGVDMDWAVIA